MSQKAEYAEQIKKKALELGFDACGITTTQPVEEERSRLLTWLLEGNHADMSWMENHREKRLDPSMLVPGSKSVVVVLHNYYFHNPPERSEGPVVSRYARGRDYHKVIKKKLVKLKQFIHEEIHPVEGRVFVDSAPLLERALAKRAGLGWTGKNSMFLNRRLGSFFFIGELVIDLALPADNEKVTDFCGTCMRCIDACPTHAIVKPYVVDARKCISWATIEFKGSEINGPAPADFRDRLFGCDICQDVCPWNQKTPPSTEEDYLPAEGMLQMDHLAWEALDEDTFIARFGHTPLMRAGYEGIKRNLRFITPKD